MTLIDTHPAARTNAAGGRAGPIRRFVVLPPACAAQAVGSAPSAIGSGLAGFHLAFAAIGVLTLVSILTAVAGFARTPCSIRPTSQTRN